MAEMVKSFEIFRGKKVLVTGDTGFKGSWLSLWLNHLGAEVAGFALPPEADTDLYCLLGLKDIVQHTDGDIRDLDAFRRVVQTFQPEIIFHLAAQPLVRLSYDDPKTTFDTNVGGSVNVLEVARQTPSLRVLVYVTTDKCYKNREWLWGYRENDELGGHDPYSASKAAAELVFSSYVDSFFSNRADIGVASVRAGNVIGGGDWALDRIVPDCIKALQEGDPIAVRNPSAVRPWQHVLEPLSGYLLTAARLYEDPKKYEGPWNFGPEKDAIRTVEELTEKILSCWGGGRLEITREKDAPHEANLLRLNCDKASQLLSWQPCWDFDRAVEKTVSWHREVFGGASPLELTLKNIESYMEANDD